MQGNYPVITLCGSTRFKDQFMEVQKKLTLEGNIVISVGLFGHSGDSEVWENMDEGTLTKTKEMLDDMHKRKIDMADEIFVINVDGYIGESTRSEIDYAIAKGKKVRYLEDPEKDMHNEEDEKKAYKAKVPIKLIVDAVEMACDEWDQFLDLEKMEIVSIPDGSYFGDFDEDDEELSELIEEGFNERFFRLPTKFDIHEYRIMEHFVYDLPAGEDQDRLERAIRGSGAFRRFRDNIERMGLLQNWYDYKDEAYKEIAREWCDDNSFEAV
ncbi:Uncharacterised protein family (UPF0158) [Butyrivibrio sp. ob235]|uniref:UPF0158 family protein n=1 Tax=Butyrivibrio sp. ob235 TaxID=1761780 RepID=UPI0008D725F9|nr:UPF0158 family protein [Butyrivibrio sp. ob235]SEM37885.1 Uncharacterised protein family (UPF0158) [Butyrivibrio sp. ob235]